MNLILWDRIVIKYLDCIKYGLYAKHFIYDNNAKTEFHSANVLLKEDKLMFFS